MPSPLDQLHAARSLEDLGRTAERLGLRGRLEAPVTQLLHVPGAGASVAELVGTIAEEGVASSVGELLTEPEPALRVPRRAREVLLEVARRYLAAGVAAGEVGTEGAEVGPPRPRTAEELRAWAKERGVEDALDALADAIAPVVPRELASFFRLGFGTQLTISELVVPPREPKKPLEKLLRSGADGDRLSRAAWIWLVDEAEGRRRVRATEEELLARAAAVMRDADAAPTQVAMLRRLLEARASVRARLPGRGPPLAGEEPLSVEGEPAALVYRALAPPRGGLGALEPVTVRLPLEAETLAPRCTCGNARGEDGGSACGHALAALGAARELLTEPTRADEARRIAAELATPGWARMLRAVDATVARRAAKAEAPEARLAWRVKPLGPYLEIVAYRQARKTSGGFTRGSRLSLSELSREPELLSSDADRRAFEALAPELAVGAAASRSVPTPLMVARAALALAGHPRLGLGDDDTQLRIREARLALLALPREDGLELVPAVDGRPVELSVLRDAVAAHAPGPHVALLDAEREVLHVVRVEPAAAELLEVLATRGASLPAEAAPDLASRAPSLQGVLPLLLPENLKGEKVPPEPTLVLRLSPLGAAGVIAELLARPLPPFVVTPGEGLAEVLGEKGGKTVHALRDLAGERHRAEAVAATLPLPAEAAQGPFRWVIDRPDEALDLVSHLARTPSPEGEVVIEWPEGRRTVRAGRTSDLKLRVARKRDWLGLEGELEVDGERIELALLLEAARRGKRWVEVRPGTFVALEGALREKLALTADATFASKDGIELSLPGLAAIEELAEAGAEVSAPELDDLLGRMRAARSLDPERPPELAAELRGYQLEGFRWMARLASWGGGGVLADDMGLGKTVQAITLLCARAASGPALVVAPTSVVPNWIAELGKFAPSLRPRLYRTLRDREEALALGPNDVLVASYGLVARDAALLAGARFSTLVLDEAHAVKNAATRRAKAVRGLAADARFALTGTPVENHLGELHSLLRAVLPGLLGSWEQFRDRFALPIERDGDASRRAALAALLRPFLLRRRKRDVAAELPPRTEVEVPVELSASERRLYEDTRLAAVGHLAGLAPEAPEKRRFEVLAALTRLRLLSCHPRLADPQSQVPSSKLSRLLELLDELRAEGHRVLVFSQFVKHLSLVREALDDRRIRYLYLDGATPAGERGRLADTFQRGEGGDLFLISLRAGGTGLNLMAADAVVLLDPWWNPAVEDQAADRAHRIGQTRPVTVLRLVTRGTIEEAILRLHADKRALVSDLLEGTDAAGTLGTEDLLALLEEGAAAVAAVDEEEASAALADEEPPSDGDVPAPKKRRRRASVAS